MIICLVFLIIEIIDEYFYIKKELNEEFNRRKEN